MKIAVLSDIHGNHIALQKVLNEIKNTNIKKIFIAGDFHWILFLAKRSIKYDIRT